MNLRNHWLYGKTVILTGGARMGSVIADALYEYRVNLIGTYQNSEIRVAKFSSVAMKVDVSKDEEVSRFVTDVKNKFGHIDALIHMAAPYERISWDKLDEQAWHRSIEAIATSAFLLAKKVGDEMLQNEADQMGVKGKMIFVSDWAVERPYKEYLPYLTAKGAVETLVRCLANELKPHILVNTIRPGPMIPANDLPEQEDEQAMAGTPLKRWGGADPIARAIRFLLEEDFASGSSITVDGGRSVSYE